MRRIYLDCDGVLADFDSGFEQSVGINASYYEDTKGSKAFWLKIRSIDNFFENLPLMGDARVLFNAVEHLRPVILTGCPFGGWAEPQKLRWRDKHFPGIPMVTCMSRNKKDYCKPGDILIDDVTKYKTLWEESGGVFIEHINAALSINQLESLKVL